MAGRVAIADLLDHTGTWYGDAFGPGVGLDSSDDALPRYLAEVLPALPQLFLLGEFFSYNIAGFSLLGRLLAVAAGTTDNAAVKG